MSLIKEIGLCNTNQITILKDIMTLNKYYENSGIAVILILWNNCRICPLCIVTRLHSQLIPTNV